MSIPILIASILEEEERDSLKKIIPRSKRMQAFYLPEEEFIRLYRLNKNLCHELIEKLRPALEPRSCRRIVFSVETKVLCALRFFAVGSYQKCVANDICNSMSQQSVSNCIKSVTVAINDLLLDDIVQFPVLESDRNAVKEEFFSYSGFPGVIGAIDCTHIAIVAPPNDGIHNEKNYVNRKGYHSINVQLICDLHMKILSVSARFPGCTHDGYVWKMSALRNWFVLNSAVLKNTWLLGDSGYPLEPWLMTPTDDSSRSHNYNIAHKRGRSVIERCNGVLKSRFRCLLKHRTLNYNPTFAASIVNACVVLHNMCISQGLVLSDEAIEGDDPFNTGLSGAATKQAENVRNSLADMLNV